MGQFNQDGRSLKCARLVTGAAPLHITHPSTFFAPAVPFNRAALFCTTSSYKLIATQWRRNFAPDFDITLCHTHSKLQLKLNTKLKCNAKRLHTDCILHYCMCYQFINLASGNINDQADNFVSFQFIGVTWENVVRRRSRIICTSSHGQLEPTIRAAN